MTHKSPIPWSADWQSWTRAGPTAPGLFGVFEVERLNVGRRGMRTASCNPSGRPPRQPGQGVFLVDRPQPCVKPPKRSCREVRVGRKVRISARNKCDCATRHFWKVTGADPSCVAETRGLLDPSEVFDHPPTSKVWPGQHSALRPRMPETSLCPRASAEAGRPCSAAPASGRSRGTR